MNYIPIPLSLVLFLAPTTTSSAADPAWWAARGVTTTSLQSNRSPAAIGQAKWMVKQALAELEGKLDTAELQALAAEIASITSLAVPQTAGEKENMRRVLLVGQLKALCAPFYQHFQGANPLWLETQLQTNLTKDPSDAGNFYPWSSNASDDANKAIATLGQVKSVFALRFTEDLDGNQLPDFWEYRYFGGVENSSSADPDGDGLTNLQEAALGTNPMSRDTDGDLVPDNQDLYPLDPTRSGVPPANDTTAPQIFLTSPGNATPNP